MAVTTNTVHEVWTTGAAGNGGGFDPSVSVPGTDYSQQAASQKTYTDIVIGAVSTTGTSALIPFVAADVGNVYNITTQVSGTVTIQRVVLISLSGVVATFNASLGTTGGVAGATMGGAYGGAVTGALTQPARIPGNTVYVKATATYSVTATNTFSIAGTAGNPITYIGYTTTRTDGGMVTVLRSSGTTVNIFSSTVAFLRFYNFIADGNSAGTATTGFLLGGLQNILGNCRAQNFVTNGFSLNTGSAGAQFVNCYATGGVTGATGAFTIMAVSILNAQYFGCVAAGNQCTGFINQSSAVSGRAVYMRCIAANNTVAGSHGFQNSGVCQMTLSSCVAYGNAGSGLLLDTTTQATAGDAATVLNCVFVNNGVYGISSNTTNYTAAGMNQLLLNYNAFYNNTSGPRNQVPIGANDVTLTGDPFTNGAGLDFSTISTGAGAALRAAGFPGVLQAGGTGFMDIGALQHADPAGGGGAAILAGGGLGLVQTG